MIQNAINQAIGIAALATGGSKFNLQARMKQAMSDVQEKQQAIKQQMAEREKNKAMVKQNFGWVGTLGPDAQKAAIRQLPELQAALLKDKKLEESINGK